MSIESGSRRREVHTAWFIAALMLAALVYFVSQGGLLQQFLSDEPDTADDSPSAVHGERAQRLTHYRRTVVLPLATCYEHSDSLELEFSRLKTTGVNWVEIRIPIWTPTTRRLEYDRFTLDEIPHLVQLAHRTQLGVTVSVLYWDGAALTVTPQVDVTSGLYSSYRDMLLDVAQAATDADAFLLDALFGASDVSAAEWLELLGELRTAFHGAIEQHVVNQEKFSPYLRQLDAAHFPTDSSVYRHLRRAEPNLRLFLRSEESDSYTSGLQLWKAVLQKVSVRETALLETIALAAELDKLDGFTLCGERAYRQCAMDTDYGTEVMHSFRALVKQQFLRELEGPGHELHSRP